MEKIKFKELIAIREQMINDKGFEKRGMNKGKYLRELTEKIVDFIETNELVDSEEDFYGLLIILQGGIVKDANRMRERREEIKKMTLAELIQEKDKSLKPMEFKNRK